MVEGAVRLCPGLLFNQAYCMVEAHAKVVHRHRRTKTARPFARGYLEMGKSAFPEEKNIKREEHGSEMGQRPGKRGKWGGADRKRSEAFSKTARERNKAIRERIRERGTILTELEPITRKLGRIGNPTTPEGMEEKERLTSHWKMLYAKLTNINRYLNDRGFEFDG